MGVQQRVSSVYRVLFIWFVLKLEERVSST